MENPALRTDIQMIMTRVEGRRVVVFQDPYELSRQQLAVDAGALPLLQMLDGRHGIRDIQRELIHRGGGRLVCLSDIESFLARLDEAFLLDSEAYRREMLSLCDAFSRDERRPCAHAGKSYDSDPERLARFIEESEAALPGAGPRPSEIHALVAPHIDLRVARRTYAGLYRHLRGRRYDLAVVLGINHHAQDGLFCISSKNYLTPFGETRTDRDFVRGLQDRVGPGTFSAGDFGHKIEHSIEFQTLFLRHYLGDTPIVPILCGGIHEFLLSQRSPFGDGRFSGFVEAVREEAARRRRVLFVAGVDLSHVGLKFGDGVPAESILPRAQSSDRRILDRLLAGDGPSIYAHAAETGDSYKVCGLPALLVIAELLKGKPGMLLDYQTYREPATSSAVTYAAAMFAD
ncbi:MAG: AmmeMemoRadiSam system protein B [Syntrophaceae bacterium]|nr:AmmeMemoRadiSam system protein B [Syntrophaceae bacterium]